MGISQHMRFENHMDIASVETKDDAKEISDDYDDNPYDDDFEAKISQVDKNIAFEKNPLDIPPEYVDKTKDSVSNMGKDVENREDGIRYDLNPTHATFKESKESEWKEDEIVEDSISGEGENDLNLMESGIDMKKDIVYKSIVDANPDYGNGGGNQYFIPHAYDLKQDGRLQQQPNSVILEFSEEDVLKADIRNSTCTNQKIHIDKRNLSEEEAQQLIDSSSDGISDVSIESFREDELQYLDDNTIATEGLTNTYDRFFVNEKGEIDSHEDYYHPHGNQEDTYKEGSPEGWFMPDGWSNPQELKDGESYYQLTALYNDGKKDVWTSYFTDEATVDSCRDANGIVSAAALLQKLQMQPKKEVEIDQNGENHEVYVNKYELAAYVYRKDD